MYAHRRAGLGAAGRHPWGWRRIQARWSTCLLLPAVQRRRVESLVLGALSSSPVHRALVLVLGTNIAVLLDCSKSSRQCSLPYFLTYLCSLSLTTGRRRPSFRSPPPQGWGYRQPDSRCIARCGRRLVTAGHAAGSTLLSAVEACGRHGPYLRPAVCGRARRPPCAQGSLVSSSSRSKGSPGPRRQRQRSPPVPGDAKS